MNAIISCRNPGKGEKLLSFFGCTHIQKRKLQSLPEILHIALPSKPRNEGKLVKKVKKILNRYGIKHILFEKDIKEKYTSAFEEEYQIADGCRVRLHRLKETMVRLMKYYGFQKGKVRLAVAAAELSPELTELIRTHQEYFQFVVLQGKKTARKQKEADALYREFGLNVILKESAEHTDCDLLLLADRTKVPFGSSLKLILNTSGVSVQTEAPTLNDCKLSLPPELAAFDCSHAALSEIAGMAYPLKGLF